MTSDGGTAAQRDLSLGYLDEDEALLDARDRGLEFGCPPIGPAQGAALRFLAATLRARSVVEIGTGAGVSGLWLLRGMARGGVLTSIDVEPELQRAARAGFLAAGYPSSRVRLINGMALDVLPRLADRAYDLVFVDAVTVEYPRYLDEAIRLLRPGGVVALAGPLSPSGAGPTGAAPNPPKFPRSMRAAEDNAVREVLRLAFEDESLVPLWLDKELLAVTKAAD